MLKSKILIISTMILFILSISAVNAENVTSSIVNDTVNNEFHIIDGKYLEYNNSENGKNLNDASNVLYDGKNKEFLENKNSNDAIFKYDGNNTVVSCLGFLTACKYNINLESTSIAMCDLV